MHDAVNMFGALFYLALGVGLILIVLSPLIVFFRMAGNVKRILQILESKK